MTISWAKRLVPLLVTQAFLWTTVLLFFYGPWPWPMRDPAKLWAFLISAHAALALGYLSAAHAAPARSNAPLPPRKLIHVCLLANLVAIPITGYARTGTWTPNLIAALANPGAVYSEALQTIDQGGNAAFLMRIALSPVLIALPFLTLFWWRQLSPLIRWSAVGCIFAVILLSVATGQRRDIGDLIMTVPFVVIASHWARVTTISRRGKLALSGGLAAFLVLFVAYFTYSHISRIGQNTASYGINPITFQLPDPNHPLLRELPEEARPGFMGVTNYLTTGYYGLYLSMEKEFEPMYGVGNSIFLSYVAARLLNDPGIQAMPYPVRISDQDGFTYPVFWTTAYPYFASDLGFVGTVLLMFVIGRLYALTWIDCLGGQSPSAVVLFSLFTILVIYLPATNRMLQDGEAVVASYVWLFLWWESRRLARVPAGALSPA